MNTVQIETETATPQNKSQQLLDGQRDILQAINEDRPLEGVLDLTCRVVEAQVEGLMCSVLLLDESGQHLLNGAAPSLPKGYSEAVNGASIGHNVGSCGAAAYSGQPVIVEDIATHPNWAAIRAFAFEKHGLRACWSTPVRAYDGRVVATFAMYYREPRTPTLAERKLIDFTSHLVAIAINRHHERQAIARAGD
jgi:GAF domain-containing protein